MAQRVEKNTFAFVQVPDALGNVVELRRAVFAGDEVPDEWRIGEDEAESAGPYAADNSVSVQDEKHLAEHKNLDVSSGAHPDGKAVGTGNLAKKVKGA